MRLRTLHIGFWIFILMLASLNGKAAVKYEPPKWIDKEYRSREYPNSLYFVQFGIKENVKRKDRDTTEVMLIKELQGKISQQILTFISTESLLLQSESTKYGYYEIFTKKTRSFSKNILFDTKPLVWYDRKTRRLYGLYAVKKKDLGEKYTTLLGSELAALDKELEDYDSGKKKLWALQNDLKAFIGREKELKELKNIIISTGVIPSENINKLFSSIGLHIIDLDNVIHSAEIEAKIRSAQELLVDGMYEDAYKAFKMISLDLPDDPRIRKGMAESKKAIEQYYLFRINQFVKRDQYDDALNLFEKLFKILPGTRESLLGEFSTIEKKMFTFLCEKLDSAFLAGDISEIKSNFKKLTGFSFVNPEKYKNYKVKVNNAIAYDYYIQAQYLYKNRYYTAAIAAVNNALRLEPGNNRYMQLHENAGEMIYRQKVRDLKSTRHHIMVFQFGGGIQTHKTFFYEFVDDKKDSYIVWIPSFSVGLFAKYGIHSKINANGRDLSKSNLVGLQYTFVNPRLQYSFDVNFEKRDLNYWQEIEFVVGFATKWLFETGLANSRFSTSMSIKDVNFFTASLIRRFYTHPVELTMQFKTYVSSDWDFYPVFKIGIFFDVNMIRKVSHEDKKKIREDIASIR